MDQSTRNLNAFYHGNNKDLGVYLFIKLNKDKTYRRVREYCSEVDTF